MSERAIEKGFGSGPWPFWRSKGKTLFLTMFGLISVLPFDFMTAAPDMMNFKLNKVMRDF